MHAGPGMLVEGPELSNLDHRVGCKREGRLSRHRTCPQVANQHEALIRTVNSEAITTRLEHHWLWPMNLVQSK